MIVGSVRVCHNNEDENLGGEDETENLFTPLLIQRPITVVYLGRCRIAINASTPFIPIPPFGKHTNNYVTL